MTVFTFHLAKTTMRTAIRALYRPPTHQQAHGLTHAECMTRMTLGAPILSPARMQLRHLAYGPRIHGRPRPQLAGIVQTHLQAVGLWDEVSTRLKSPATSLSVGQQQRLCLARSMAVEPDVLLCDESTASLDPISARGIEALLKGLRGRHTLVMVTHDIDQARRMADYVVFMWLGEVAEHGPAADFFANPREDLTRAYLAREVG